MKTKLLFLLLFVSSLTFAQNWSQVGNAQFSEFATDAGKIAFNPNNGDVYVLYKNPIDSGMYVMLYDGSTWSDVGGVISTTSYNTYALNVNPVTNEPWVVLKRAQSGSASNHDVFRFDGTNWVQEANGIAGVSFTIPTQIHFNASGTPRFTQITAAGGSSRRLQYVTYNATNNWSILSDAHVAANYWYDYTGFDEFVSSWANNRVLKRTINTSNSQNTTFDATIPLQSTSYVAVSAIAETNYYVAANQSNGFFFANGTDYTLNQPNGAIVEPKKNFKFRKSDTDNNFYMMYNNTSDEIAFEKYNTLSQNWTNLPSIGVSTTATNFFSDMGVNPADGNVYVMYQDGPRVSVKMYTVEQPLQLPRIYVNKNATGNETGESWTNAFTELSDALNNVQIGVTTEIWVAAGTYIPGVSTSDSFNLTADNLEVYGGFNGTENTVSERDVLANPTILSGDVNGDDGPTFGFIRGGTDRIDNILNIVKVNGENIVIDGFQINNGMANGSGDLGYGAAVSLSSISTNPEIRNCQFNNNVNIRGGAVRVHFNVNTTMIVENCSFSNNLSRYGSGLYVLVNNNRTVDLNVTNCLFEKNTSKDLDNSSNRGYTGSSAWIRANGTGSNLTTTITNCTFVNNTDIGTQSGSQRGSLSLARRADGNSTHNATINNCIFYHNEGAGGTTTAAVNQGHVSMPNLTFVNNSISEDSFSNLTFLTNTSGSDPMFTDANNNDFTLQAGSPAIDTGDNSKVPSGVIADLLGNQRIFNATVDMGVYEFGAPSLSNSEFEVTTNDIRVYPNPTSATLNIQSNVTITNVEVYDVLGKKVLESQETLIDVSSLNKGMYLLKVKSDNGVTTKRFVKR